MGTEKTKLHQNSVLLCHKASHTSVPAANLFRSRTHTHTQKKVDEGKKTWNDNVTFLRPKSMRVKVNRLNFNFMLTSQVKKNNWWFWSFGKSSWPKNEQIWHLKRGNWNNARYLTVQFFLLIKTFSHMKNAQRYWEEWDEVSRHTTVSEAIHSERVLHWKAQDAAVEWKKMQGVEIRFFKSYFNTTFLDWCWERRERKGQRRLSSAHLH